MSDSLEHLLDNVLDMRRQRRRQHEAELGVKEWAIRGSHAELERRQTRFSAEVRSLIRQAVEQANHHLATRPERCEFCEVTEYSMGPWCPGGSICNPIAYKLLVDGQEVGETLVVELTHDGMVRALLGRLGSSDHQTYIGRVGFGWHLIPLFSFDNHKATELLVQYLAAITQRWPLDKETLTE